jgi:RHS repeat-associated protein
MTVSGQSQVNYVFDNANRLTSITQAAANLSFGYDNDGRRTSMTLPNGILAVYSYDAASQLTGIAYQGGALSPASLVYSYDLAGRRVGTSGSLANALLPAATSTAAYNANNQLTQWGSATPMYDANGNTLNDGTNTYTWDARNRLISANNNGASFTYDGLGRRTGKNILSVSNSFLYDGANPVQELNGTTPTANMLTGGIDELFQRTDSSGSWSYLTDALGSTMALTNSAGASQVQYSYDSYGNMSVSGGATTNSYTYTGRETDGLGLYYYRARYYNPQLGRFLSEDPIGFQGGIDLYAYADDDPIENTDANGTLPGLPPEPYHSDGITRCYYDDSCPTLVWKMAEIMLEIGSHQLWDWTVPKPRGDNRHKEDIENFWRGYARCQAIYAKKCPNCNNNPQGGNPALSHLR